MVHFEPKMAKQGRLVNAPKSSKRVEKGPKGTKMVSPSVFDHLGPFWAHRGPFGSFQTTMIFLPQMDKVGFGGGAPEQKVNFCLKWPKRVQTGPKGSWMVKNTWVDHHGPFWTLLDHFGTLTSQIVNGRYSPLSCHELWAAQNLYPPSGLVEDCHYYVKCRIGEWIK